jgi:hypothetical protein
MLITSDLNIAVYIGIEVILGLSIITIIVLSSVGYSSLQYSLRAVSDINLNWMKSPILDIIDAQGSCPTGYSALLEDTWKGTVWGCDCVGRWSWRIDWDRQNRLNRDSCSWNETMGGCTDIRSTSGMSYNTYKGKTICIKRAGTNFFDNFKNAVTSKKSCYNGMKQCGTLDSSGNLLCVDKYTNCPINKIVMQTNDRSKPTDHNYSQISLGYTNLFFTNEAVENSIIMELKLSEGDVCVDPGEKNTQYSQYILDVDYYNYGCKNKINGNLYDDRFVKLDSIVKRDLFAQNQITSVLNSLPYYPYSSLDANVDLFTRPYIGWNIQCVGDKFDDPQIVTVLANEISGITTIKLVIIIFSIISIVYFIIHLCLKWSNCGRGSYSVSLFNILELILILFCSVILILGFVLVGRNSGYSNALLNFNCGDSITNYIFSNLGLNFEANLTYDKWIVFLSIYNSFVYVVYMLIQIFNAQNCWNRMVSGIGSSERGGSKDPYLNKEIGYNSSNNNYTPNQAEVFPSSNNYESHKSPENFSNVPPAGYTSYSNYPSLGEINNNPNKI